MSGMKKPFEKKENKESWLEVLGFSLKPFLKGKIFKKVKKPKKIIFCGMGGSGLGAKIFLSLKDYFKIKEEMKIIQDFDNKKIEPSSLIISISYSGNTKETISFTKKACLKKANLFIVSSDGGLLDLAQKKKINYFLLPEGYLPRNTVFFQFFVLGEILEKVKVIEFWKKIPKFKLKVDFSLAQNLAQRIGEKMVLIFSSQKNQFLGYDLKIRLEEDALTPSFQAILPEATHNTLAALKDFSSKIFPIFLISKDDLKQNQKVAKLTIQALKNFGYDLEEIFLEEKNPIKRIFSQIAFNVTLSLSLKEIKKIDPQFQKKFLKEFKKKV